MKKIDIEDLNREKQNLYHSVPPPGDERVGRERLERENAAAVRILDHEKGLVARQVPHADRPVVVT